MPKNYAYRLSHSNVERPDKNVAIQQRHRNHEYANRLDTDMDMQKDSRSARFSWNGRPSQIVAENLEITTNFLINELPPGSMDYNQWRQAKGMLDIWTKKSTLKAARKAEQLLERLVKEAAVNKHVKLNATMYNQCMNAWARSGANDAGLRANAILQRMQSRHYENPVVAPEPDTITFHTLLHTWASSEDDRATAIAEELIYLMEERHRMNPEGAVIPNTWSYNLVMLAYANRVGEYGSAKAAEDWLLRLSELGINDGPRPDTLSFNLVLKAWANAQDEKGPDRALEILSLFIKLSKEGHDVHPDASSFTTVISSFAKRGQVMKAQEVLYLTREVDLPERTDITPCFNAVIDAWAKSGAKDAGHMAETVLSNAQSYSEIDASVVVNPNVITYTSCLDAHTKSDHPRALENAEYFLRRMIDSFRSGEGKVGPTTKTFNCIIGAWARSDRENRAEKAQSWMNLMEELAKKESFKCRPNSETYNFCIDAWSHSNATNATARATRLLHKMEQVYEKGDKFTRPSGFSYRVIIKRLLSSGEKDDALEALYFVKRMEEQARRGNIDARPDTSTCNKVIYRLTQTRDEEAIKGALNLIRWMDEAATEGLTCMRPDTWTFTTVMSALSKLPNHEAQIAAAKLYDRMEELHAVGNNGVRLNSTAIRIALTALSSIREKWAADRACSIYERAAQVNGEGNPGTMLDSLCLTICLENVLSVGTFEYTRRAHSLLKEMMERYSEGKATHMPLRDGFVSVIDALSKSEDKASVQLAQEILTMVEDIPFERHFRKGPGALFYSKAIDLLIKYDSLQEAEAVLSSWEDKCFCYEDTERANSIIWNKLLRAWSKSSSDNKVDRARGLLNRMKQCANQGCGGAMPDITSYNTVLNAASFAGSNMEIGQNALRIANLTFEELKEQSSYLKPDEVTYGTMLKAIDRFMKPGPHKMDFMKSIFEESCASGHDGPMVINEIRKALADDEIQDIRNNFSAQRRGVSI